jgi:cytoskeletal protein CcmA (bactofilin family)
VLEPHDGEDRASEVGTITTADLTIVGAIVARGAVDIDGRVLGNIQARLLRLGERSQVTGNIAAEEVVIAGRVEGNIAAGRITLAASAQVVGDIEHQGQLHIAFGALFEGRCSLRGGGGTRKVAAEAQPPSRSSEALAVRFAALAPLPNSLPH